MPRATRCMAVLILCAGTALCVAADASAAVSPGGWDHLGTGATPDVSALTGRVDALHATGPGALYAGGAFTSAGGDAAGAHIARWDGSAWHALGAPTLNGDVRAIAYDNGRLYVGGVFTNAGDNAAADFLAVWDGVSWQPFCNPITATVNTLQVVGRELYIGGDFADGAGIASADKLVACNLDTGVPSSTVDTDGDINSSVYALAADSSGRLYAGGTFINMDQIPAADHVAMYDGAWHALGSGGGPGGGAVDDIVRSLAASGTDVYLGTDALDVAGIPTADHVARWDGTAWSALGANALATDGWFPATAFIYGLAADGSTVYAGGSFQNADGRATADMVARFDGAGWAPMGSDGAGNGPLGGPANAVAVFGGQAIVGGNFNSAGGDTRAGYVARYPGIANAAPTADATVQNPGFTRYPVRAHWSGHDTDGVITAYRWSWGDGSPDDAGATSAGDVQHTYAAAGTYHLDLVVTDNDGGQGEFAQTVVVRTGPKAAFTWTPQTPMVGEQVSFHGAATDVDGTIIGYNWFLDPLPLGSRLGTNLINVGPSPAHTFTIAGGVRVNMVAYECDPASCYGADSNIQTLTVVPAVIPTMTKAKLTNTSFTVGSAPTAVIARVARGTRFEFRLRAPATITVTITRRGKRVGMLTRRHRQPGANVIPFSGRIGKRPLHPGSYRATLRARNGAGRAKPVSVAFTVLR